MAITSTTITETPPPLQGPLPTAKEKKYDRQLRLWAASGQQALENSHALLVIPDEGDKGSGSSAAGIETLKNLVLPGIGAFTIADTAAVAEADLGINFFLEASSLGKSRAAECSRLLEELNPDVKGHVITEDLATSLQENTSLRKINLILLCSPHTLDDSEDSVIASLIRYAAAHTIPLISLHSVGFYSRFSVQLPREFPIVDTHPDPDSIQDLRLLKPWPELSTEVEALGNITTLSDQDHGHIPYVPLLLYYLEEYKNVNDGKYPNTFKEKTQFRDLVRSGARTDNAEGGEENYDEACGAVLKTITPPTLEPGCRELFELLDDTNHDTTNSHFWTIAEAIHRFYKRNGVLPLPGSVPDMKAKSADYIKLQNIYKLKAREDLKAVTEDVRDLEARNKRVSPAPDVEIEAFCKNAAHVKVVQGSPLPTNLDPARITRLTKKMQFDDDSLLPIWLALHMVSSSKTNILPEFPPEIRDRINAAIAEVKRASGGEMHNVSSVTGGMVAQECIKIITRQYVPVDNTCIFDGIKGKTEVVRL